MQLLKQADSYIPTSLLRYIGGLRTYAARLNFFLGIPNSIMISILFYNSSPIAQSIFPSVFYWVGFISFVFIPTVVFTDRFLLHPAQITYQAHQNSKTNRNPIYEKVEETNKIIKEMKGNE